MQFLPLSPHGKCRCNDSLNVFSRFAAVKCEMEAKMRLLETSRRSPNPWKAPTLVWNIQSSLFLALSTFSFGRGSFAISVESISTWKDDGFQVHKINPAPMKARQRLDRSWIVQCMKNRVRIAFVLYNDHCLGAKGHRIKKSSSSRVDYMKCPTQSFTRQDIEISYLSKNNRLSILRYLPSTSRSINDTQDAV